jgi:hypothetical protein
MPGGGRPSNEAAGIDSRDGRRGERVDCGRGRKDRVKADRGERVAKNCERVKRG